MGNVLVAVNNYVDTSFVCENCSTFVSQSFCGFSVISCVWTCLHIRIWDLSYISKRMSGSD